MALDSKQEKLKPVGEYLGVVAEFEENLLMSWEGWEWEVDDGGAVRSSVMVGLEGLEEIEGFGR